MPEWLGDGLRKALAHYKEGQGLEADNPVAAKPANRPAAANGKASPTKPKRAAAPATSRR